MRRLLLLAFAAASASAQTPDVSLMQRYQATITPSELAGHLYVYADDYMAGRETGRPGQRFAARYLAGQYQTMGVQPHGTAPAAHPYDIAPYLQPFMLERNDLGRLSITVSRGGAPVLQSVLADGSAGSFAPVAGAPPADPTPAHLVFAGTGAAALDAVDVAGAYVLVLADPAAGRSDVSAMLRAAGAKGALGLILATEPTSAALHERAVRALGAGRLALPADSASGPFEAGGRFPYTLFTGRDTAAEILAAAGAVDLATATLGDTGLMLSVDAQTARVSVPTENVVAMVEGSDPALKNEFVIVSAHLDHIGIDSSLTGDQINNGADDDGSGTVSLLEIAEAFQQAKMDGHGPRRSVLFLHVTGEEKGLLGSEYFADREPLVPLANVAADLNIDMIGRHDPTYDGAGSPYVYILGSELISTDIDAVSARVNAETGLNIDLSKRFNSADDPNQFFRRSDHWNFGKHGIPFIFYFTGTHEDYHQPGDEAWKIDYDRMAMIARLVFGTAWEIANTDARPAVSGTGFN